jgi:molybdopterin molybdotransferase
MIPYQQAYDLVLGAARTLAAEHVPLADAYNRVLAADVLTDRDIPPFDKAAVDGYVCGRPTWIRP